MQVSSPNALLMQENPLFAMYYRISILICKEVRSDVS